MDENRREQWARLLSEQADSGLSKKAFCTHKGIKTANFYYWQKQLGQEAQAGFTPLTARPADCQVSVRLPGGTWLEVRADHWSQLASLLQAMEQPHA